MTSWFVLFSIIFCLNFNFLFRHFLSIPSGTKIKSSFGANSRKENKFLNLDYLAGPITWVINVKYVADFSTFSNAHWIIKFFVRHKNNKKTSPNLDSMTLLFHFCFDHLKISDKLPEENKKRWWRWLFSRNTPLTGFIEKSSIIFAYSGRYVSYESWILTKCNRLRSF